MTRTDPRVFADNGHNQLCHESVTGEGARGQAPEHHCKKPYFKHEFVPTAIVTSVFLFIAGVVKPTSH